MMKFALGLFHFNVQYIAGDTAISHRYCSQAILPFLESISARPSFRTNFELCGSGLEFLAEHYPAGFELLKKLIVRGQVELISSTYAPTLWVAYPKRDLIKSIEINRRCLEQLGLKASGIFFAQEAFFGNGVSELTDFFSVACCKDEYLRFQLEIKNAAPVYRVGNMPVVVGANHLLNELARAHLQQEITPDSQHLRRIKAASAALPHSPLQFVSGSVNDVGWHWYHLGSGHHFSTSAAPSDWENFFAEPSWIELNLSRLDHLVSAGYRLSTISEFMTETKAWPRPALPPLVEGSWNTEKSRGVYAWMGKQENQWTQNTSVLGLSWRSRSQLRRCESLIEQLPEGSRLEWSDPVDTAWKQQIVAESSDPHGWTPLPVESMFGRSNAEEALRSAIVLEHKIRSANPDLPGILPPDDDFFSQVNHEAPPPVQATLYGGEGAIHWRWLSATMAVCDLELHATSTECGILFPRTSPQVAFSPTGMETKLAVIDSTRMKPEMTWLPLSNGFIALGEKLFLIRINRFGQPAARISRLDRNVAFVISGPIHQRVLKWRFMVCVTELRIALEMANHINQV